MITFQACLRLLVSSDACSTPSIPNNIKSRAHPLQDLKPKQDTQLWKIPINRTAIYGTLSDSLSIFQASNVGELGALSPTQSLPTPHKTRTVDRPRSKPKSRQCSSAALLLSLFLVLTRHGSVQSSKQNVLPTRQHLARNKDPHHNPSHPRRRWGRTPASWLIASNNKRRRKKASSVACASGEALLNGSNEVIITRRNHRPLCPPPSKLYPLSLSHAVQHPWDPVLI